jgi:DNA-binding NtrC family response regulator
MSSLKILVVDDEAEFLDVITERFKNRRLEAFGLTSGEQAVEKITDENFDLVLLDVKMPGGMGGIETLQEIKRIRPQTEVILLTAYASVETAIEGMRLGASDYVLKPVKFEALIEKMAEALRTKDPGQKKIRDAQIQELLDASA